MSLANSRVALMAPQITAIAIQKTDLPFLLNALPAIIPAKVTKALFVGIGPYSAKYRLNHEKIWVRESDPLTFFVVQRENVVSRRRPLFWRHFKIFGEGGHSPLSPHWF